MQLIRICLLVVLMGFGGLTLANDPVEDTRVNINTADVATLAEGLEGVGAARARAIVSYREAHGAFETPDDLIEVSGIGPQVLERNRDRIDTED